MSLPDKALFTIQEAGDQLALSRASIYRLIAEGQLQRVYPRPKAARITRESLLTLLEKAGTPGAVEASLQQHARVRAQQQKKTLAERWGLGGIFGKGTGG